MSTPDSHYDKTVLRNHPGFNRSHVIGGYRRKVLMNPDTGLYRWLPRNPSRWMPHQGKQECERRRRRMG